MKHLIKVALTWSVLMAVACAVQAAPQKRLDKHWVGYQHTQQISVDHSPWQRLLDKYVLSVDGINRFNYAQMSAADKQQLRAYLTQLQGIDPLKLTRDQQFAYWINMYNAATVALIIEHYPVRSIRRLENVISGPWNKPLVTVNQRELSLNNIEHNILRPIFKDARIHYVVNCASIGCPNLPRRALTAKNYEAQLERAAKEFINHSRAVRIENEELVLSSIYEWYGIDFGKNRNQLLAHLIEYAEPDLAAQISGYKGDIEYEYDWALNKP